MTPMTPMSRCALMRTAATTVAVLATTTATGAYVVAASVATTPAGRSRPAVRTRTSAATTALGRILGPALASHSLPEITARVTAAIDRQVDRVTTLAAAVGTSERVSLAQRARAAERLARAKADLTDLRAEVCDQTSGEGLARVLAEARRHRVFWRNWTLDHEPDVHRAARGAA